MATSVSSIPPQLPTESKSARKKKAKAEVASSPAPSKTRTDSSAGLDATEKVNGESGENAYVKELQK